MIARRAGIVVVVLGMAGVLAPAGTPGESVNRVHAEIVKLIKLKPVDERCTTLGLDPVGSSPAEFDRCQRNGIRWYCSVTCRLSVPSMRNRARPAPSRRVTMPAAFSTPTATIASAPAPARAAARQPARAAT